MAFGDLAAGFLALGEAAFFGLFFGAALGLAGDFLATVFFFAGLFAFEAGFFAGLFFLAGDLAFEAGFAGDFLAALGDLAAGLAALGDLRAARSMRTHSRRHVGRRRRAWPSRRAWRPSATWPRAWGSSWASPSSARACNAFVSIT